MSSGVHAKHKLKPSGRPPRPLPPRLALGLGAAVTAVHLWLLGSAMPPLGVEAQPAPPAPLQFSTRRIDPAPPVAARPAAPPPRPALRPARPGAAVPAAAPTQQEGPASAPAPASVAVAEPQQAAAEAVPAEAAAEAAAEAPADTPAVPPPPVAQAAAPQLPQSVRLRYELSGQTRGLSYAAQGQLTWQHDGQRYEARMVVNGLLLLRPRTMTSTGELGPLGVVPRRFSDHARTEQATHFQPERGRIVFSSNAPEAPWQPGAQDRLSLFFQLAGLLAADPALHAKGTQIQVLTAGTREADTWTFTVTGTPMLALPAGEQATVALRREPRRDYDQTIELWFAPALGHLPVRIRITQGNGDVLDQRLAAVEPM